MPFDPPFPLNLVTSSHGSTPRHCECRECGLNLHPEREQCPQCGGQAVSYDW